MPGNPNLAPVGYGAELARVRAFRCSLSYRLEYFNFGATTISVFLDNYTFGNGSYTCSGDMNGDGVSNNDLHLRPAQQSEMSFAAITGAFTPEQQAAAWDAYISQDKYLTRRRGQYAERGGAFLPMGLPHGPQHHPVRVHRRSSRRVRISRSVSTS